MTNIKTIKVHIFGITFACSSQIHHSFDNPKGERHSSSSFSITTSDDGECIYLSDNSFKKALELYEEFNDSNINDMFTLILHKTNEKDIYNNFKYKLINFKIHREELEKNNILFYQNMNENDGWMQYEAI